MAMRLAAGETEQNERERERERRVPSVIDTATSEEQRSRHCAGSPLTSVNRLIVPLGNRCPCTRIEKSTFSLSLSLSARADRKSIFVSSRPLFARSRRDLDVPSPFVWEGCRRPRTRSRVIALIHCSSLAADSGNTFVADDHHPSGRRGYRISTSSSGEIADNGERCLFSPSNIAFSPIVNAPVIFRPTLCSNIYLLPVRGSVLSKDESRRRRNNLL
jgi:hypothetical protein